MTIHHIDLFSGIGGFALALDQVCKATHEFVEYEPHLQAVLRKHWKHSLIHGDILHYTPTKNIFLVTGGFPCQDISRANTTKNKGGINGSRSGLWTEYFRVLCESRPKYCIIENVYDLLSNGIGRILQNLAGIGYDSAWTVIDSQYTGVPQRRRRVYILGVRDGIADGSDIFQCAERSAIQQQITNIASRRAAEIEEAEKKGIGYFSFQRSDEYKKSAVASTIKKCGWSMGGDFVLANNLISYLTAEEKLELQGIPRTHNQNCGLDCRQLHTANGMTIPAIKWVIEKMMDYEKSQNENTKTMDI
jgi:DNA-cytosine methyltransferase